MTLALLLLACIGPSLVEETADPGAEAPDAPDPVEPDDSGEVVTACAADLSLALTVPERPFDQCDTICLDVVVTCEGSPVAGAEAWIEGEGLGHLIEGKTDAAGRLSGCVSALPVGRLNLAAAARAAGNRGQTAGSLDLRPFGYALGLEKPVELASAILALPPLVRAPENPVFTAGPEGAWDDAGVLLPTVLRRGEEWLLYYAGSAATDYEVGLATSTDGLVWERHPSNPLFPAHIDEEGSWQRYATNSPGAVLVDGQVQLWYTGRSSETGDLALGLATSSDGRSFTEHADNPVFSPDPANSDWEANGVAHPTVVFRDGFYELWYSTGAHHLGYALSTDGIDWQRSCMGPVFSAEEVWEQGQVKSADVLYVDGTYYMAYSGGQSGEFQVGWAVSLDGQRWTRAAEPLLGPGADDSWDENSVLGTSMWLDGDTLWMWYSGTNRTGSGVGLLTGSLSP
jgi:predicted GH43/DUF377 family glycosyl hydrolase